MRALPFILILLALHARAQVAIVSRSSHVRLAPAGDAEACYHAEAGDTLVLADADDHDGYYHVRAPGGCTGYVYRNRVRLRQADAPAWARSNGPAAPGGGTAATGGRPRWLKACSFNIKFLGQGNKKQYQPLADLLKDYDLVLVQELVSAPMDMLYPGYRLPGTPQARAFFNLMEDHRFAYALSQAKTGPTTNTTNGSASEYFVAFYKPDVLRYDLAASGFVTQPLVANPVFDRVPWTFHFTTRDGTLDFAATDVHLAADAGAAQQRRIELRAIADHVSGAPERDQLILGDMNMQDCDELRDALPSGYRSLNAACLATNVGRTGKPFDHLLYRPQYTAPDIDPDHFVPLDLVGLMRSTWDATDEPYPGDGTFNVATYGAYYSDHKPVEFRMVYGVRDDD
jgi:endonuclease/exonuclease/phosphatase family metal-dependent hydrolase